MIGFCFVFGVLQGIQGLDFKVPFTVGVPILLQGAVGNDPMLSWNLMRFSMPSGWGPHEKCLLFAREVTIKMPISGFICLYCSFSSFSVVPL